MIARSPEEDSKLPYLIRLPIEGGLALNKDGHAEPTYAEPHAQNAHAEPVLRDPGGPEVHVPRDGDFVGQLEVTVRASTTREADLLEELLAASERIEELERLLYAALDDRTGVPASLCHGWRRFGPRHGIEVGGDHRATQTDPP